MSENMTVCPECGTESDESSERSSTTGEQSSTEFDTVADAEDLPLQALGQECPDCGYSVEVGIINYPDGTFTVVAPALKGDTCGGRVPKEGRYGTTTCDDDAMMRMQKLGEPIEGRCAEHMGAHHESVLALRDEL